MRKNETRRKHSLFCVSKIQSQVQHSNPPNSQYASIEARLRRPEDNPWTNNKSHGEVVGYVPWSKGRERL